MGGVRVRQKRRNQCQLHSFADNAITHCGSRGSVLLELALALPLFLMVVFIILFVAQAYAARTSLLSAVSTVRQAYTRGHSELVGSEIISEVQAWQRSGQQLPPLPVQKLLASPSEAQTA